MTASMEDDGSVQTKLSNRLLVHRNAAHATIGEYPAKLFIGRTLPSRLDLLKPNWNNKQFDVANRRYSVLRTFKPGQTVIVRDYRQSTKPNWVPGTISEKCDFSCSFEVFKFLHGCTELVGIIIPRASILTT